MRGNSLWVLTNLLLAILPLFSIGSSARASNLRTLYKFPGGNRGGGPQTGVVSDSEGNLYGTTYYGGAYGWGTVFELKHSRNGWTQEVVYNFEGSYDGFNPTGNLLIDKAGNLYGTTLYGGTGTGCQQGSYECGGTVFEMTRSDQGWKHSVLHSFCSASGCDDGAAPCALSFDETGNLYGATGAGGGGCPTYGCGTVYELTRSKRGWTENVIYAFQNGDGEAPGPGGITLDNDGNVYGTTYGGGAYYSGIVFELKHRNNHWDELVLYNFASGDGGANGGLTLDGADVIFGTTDYGNGVGGIFELRRSQGVWKETVLYSGDGANPQLILDKTGALYGTTLFGGADNDGVVFKLQRHKTWNMTVLHSFSGKGDGANPYAGLFLGVNGNFYGTTSSVYNSQYEGTVFEISK